jgi:hypothetical protein
MNKPATASTIMPPEIPPKPDSATPADLLTPHDDVQAKPVDGDEPNAEPGIIDPRRFGPPIVDPPPAGLPPPAASTEK